MENNFKFKDDIVSKKVIIAILAIFIAILALGLAIWSFIDGTYYIGAFALCICIAQVCNYFLIKRKRY